MTERQRIELDHAANLLKEIAPNWQGGRAIVPIDPTCGFRVPGEPRCGDQLHDAVCLLDKGGDTCHVLALCWHHTQIMSDAIGQWRKKA